MIAYHVKNELCICQDKICKTCAYSFWGKSNPEIVNRLKLRGFIFTIAVK
jgi:hypothetical protein